MARPTYTFSIAELVAGYMTTNNVTNMTQTDIVKHFLLLKNACKKNHVIADIKYSKKYYQEFQNDYSDLFKFNDEEISLQSNITLEDLRSQILAYVPFNQLSVLLDTVPTHNLNNNL